MAVLNTGLLMAKIARPLEQFHCAAAVMMDVIRNRREIEERIWGGRIQFRGTHEVLFHLLCVTPRLTGGAHLEQREPCIEFQTEQYLLVIGAVLQCVLQNLECLAVLFQADKDATDILRRSHVVGIESHRPSKVSKRLLRLRRGFEHTKP
jgi:hypothetical protein